MPGIGIIVNPNSKTFRNTPSKISVLKSIAQGKCLFRDTRDEKELSQVALEFKKEKIEILGIAGGDGTLRMTLSKFVEAYQGENLPLIVPIKGGTMNTTATSLKIKGNSGTILQKLLERYEKDEAFVVEERNLLCINGNHGFIFGNGFFHNFIKLYYEKAYPSVIKGFSLVTRTAASAFFCSRLSKEIFKSFRANLTLDKQNLGEMELTGVACSTIPYIGFRCNPFPRALEKRNAFHFIGFPNNTRTIARDLPKLFIGGSFESEDIIQAVASEAVIETDKPIGYQLDGDLDDGARKLTVKIGPRLKFASRENF